MTGIAARRADGFNWQVVLLACSFIILYMPLYLKLAAGPWQTEQEGHGPFLLAAAIFIAFIESRRHFAPGWRRVGRPFFGLLFFLFGLMAAIAGITQDITTLAAGSQVFILTGLLFYYFGWPGVRLMLVPLLLVAAATPPPSYLVDATTVYLKEQISDAVVCLLYHLRFDIAQNGVVIQAGPYQLLVKDACAGMNSIFALSALSILYVYIRADMPTWQKVTLFFCSLPVAICSNFIRVLSLCVITYQFGVRMEEGLHDVTGILLFVVAGGLFLLVDGVLSGLARLASSLKPARTVTRDRHPPSTASGSTQKLG